MLHAATAAKFATAAKSKNDDYRLLLLTSACMLQPVATQARHDVLEGLPVESQ